MSEHHLHPAPQDTASFEAAAQLFKYLSDPTRVRLFFILCHLIIHHIASSDSYFSHPRHLYNKEKVAALALSFSNNLFLFYFWRAFPFIYF